MLGTFIILGAVLGWWVRSVLSFASQKLPGYYVSSSIDAFSVSSSSRLELQWDRRGIGMLLPDASAELSNEDLWVSEVEEPSQFLQRLVVETARFHVISNLIHWASHQSQAIRK